MKDKKNNFLVFFVNEIDSSWCLCFVVCEGNKTTTWKITFRSPWTRYFLEMVFIILMKNQSTVGTTCWTWFYFWYHRIFIFNLTSEKLRVKEMTRLWSQWILQTFIFTSTREIFDEDEMNELSWVSWRGRRKKKHFHNCRFDFEMKYFDF